MPVRSVAREEGLDGTPRCLTRGATIFHEGEEVRFVYRLVSGCLRTGRVLGDGTRLIDAFHLPGDFIGFEAGEVHRVSAEAVTDSQVIAYEVERLGGTSDIDRALTGEANLSALASLERAQRHILRLGRRTPAERVALFLLDMSERLAGGGEEFTLPMDRGDIAGHLGTTTETVSRLFTRFAREGLLQVLQKRVTLLDRHGLAAHDHDHEMLTPARAA